MSNRTESMNAPRKPGDWAEHWGQVEIKQLFSNFRASARDAASAAQEVRRIEVSYIEALGRLVNEDRSPTPEDANLARDRADAGVRANELARQADKLEEALLDCLHQRALWRHKMAVEREIEDRGGLGLYEKAGSG